MFNLFLIVLSSVTTLLIVWAFHDPAKAKAMWLRFIAKFHKQ